MSRITPEMTILEVLYQFRQTEQVFRRYDAAAGVCLCCQALFDSLEEVAQKYGLDLENLLANLEQSAGAPPAEEPAAPPDSCGPVGKARPTAHTVSWHGKGL